jgi:hypothetical protein
MSDESRFRITGAGTGPTSSALPTVMSRCAGPSCPAGRPITEHLVLGDTPMGVLVACRACAYEHFDVDDDAELEAARREHEVTTRGADRQLALTVGPLSTSKLTRLRHPDQVTAMARAAEHAAGTPESVVLYLRSIGFELCGTAPVQCDCPTGIRSPVCGIHGDAEPEPGEQVWP